MPRIVVIIGVWLCVAGFGLKVASAGPAQPDLRPTMALGATELIVISRTAGSVVDEAAIAGSEVFIDWGVENVGAASAAMSTTAFLVDGELRAEVPTPALVPLTAIDQLDLGFLFSAPGVHELTVRVDSMNTVSESDETNNEVVRTVVVLPPAFPPGAAVIVLPGILGSQLHCGTTSDAFWPTASSTELLHLQFIRGGGSWVTNITAPQQIDLLPGCLGGNDLDPYCMLQQAAMDFGFVPGDIRAPNAGETFFFFPFDWRRDLAEVVGFDAAGNFPPGTLCARLAQLQALGITEVYFICHSMGSLVGREYLATAAQSTLLPSATKVAFAGAPFLGSVELLRALLYGRDFGSAAVAKYLLRDTPGPYHLVPSRRYFATSPFPAVLHYDWAIGGSNPPSRIDPLVLDSYDGYVDLLLGAELFRPDPWQITRELLDVEITPPLEACATASGVPARWNTANAAHILSAEAWHDARDTLPLPAGVQVVNLMGDGRPTVVQFREYPRKTPQGDHRLLLDAMFDATRGDGTVQRSSMEGVTAPGAEQYELATGHTGYFFESVVGHDLFHVFAASDPASLQRLQVPALPAPPRLPELQLHVNGPATAHARGGNGDHVGPLPGGLIAEEIAGIYHYRIGEFDTYESIIVNDLGTVTGPVPIVLTVEGAAIGSVHVKLDLATGMRERLELDYGDIAVSPASNAVISFAPGGGYPLEHDMDGDGMPDETVLPVSNHLFFVRGDADGSGTVDLQDAMATAQYVFNIAVAPCVRSTDVNADGRVDLVDIVNLVHYLFSVGPPPAAPFPQCDSEPSRLDCRVSSC